MNGPKEPGNIAHNPFTENAPLADRYALAQKAAQDNDFGVSALGELAFGPSWPVVHILAPAEDYLVPPSISTGLPTRPVPQLAAAHLSEAAAEAVRLVCHDHRRRREICDWCRCGGAW